ncbi:DNA-binding transcription factor yap1 [Emydomyces testavorans]|uniref:DNA-binding transcription factor yap1 n=1 Tax=Emydomyces testavorans TaxID=2070801 RepID=A0AAF0DKS2_9EURO|nr:DNA-binding transcription factor yap1 [Emydomyces testavorans]
MSYFDPMYQPNLFFSSGQQDILSASFSSPDHTAKPQNETTFDGMPVKVQESPNHHQNDSSSHQPFGSPSDHAAPGSGRLSFGDDSPFLDFSLDPDFEAAGGEALIGDLPGADVGEKRKSVDGKEDDENGKKRKENDEKVAKKPGRKPLTSEPTSKRKAQNRAAQRAFRERKEKHLKDLETKVDDLEKASEAANHENSLLRAQIERLQVELREYRRRLSWMTGVNGYSIPSNNSPKNNDSRTSRLNGDFSFEFPRFGDLPGAHMFGNGSANKTRSPPDTTQVSPIATMQYKAPGVLNRDLLKGSGSVGGAPHFSSVSGTASVLSPQNAASRSLYGREAGTTLRNPINLSSTGNGKSVKQPPNGINQTTRQEKSGAPGASNTNSPSTSSESHQGRASSIGTSPEPTVSSLLTANQEPKSDLQDAGNSTPRLDECEKSFYEKLNEACGCAEDPVPVALSRLKENLLSSNQQTSPESNNENSLGLDWLVQQNGGQFDPVLFNDYREPQDAVLSQEFGSFFNDAFPFPDLGNSFPNVDHGTSPVPKPDLISQIDRSLDADEEVVPGEDRSQMLSCTKIWDRLQSMEKFRNGEIDVDSLCTELRTKARCSEGGVVVNKKDVEDIMTRAS